MTYRIIQWATGSIGKTCLRQVIDHPDLDLVGLYVYSEHKRGLDAGRIARRKATGVHATTDIDDILALDADCVLHAPLEGETFDAHDDEVVQLLRSGKNVISTVAYTYPRAHGEEYVARLEAACADGAATLFGTGINPGFVVERLAVAMTGACTRVDRLTVTESYDVSGVTSAPFVFEQMGMGRPVDEIRGGPLEALYADIFAEVLAFVADRLGVRYDHVEPDHEFGLAPVDLRIGAGLVPRGTAANFRWRWHGVVDRRPFVTIEMVWIASRQISGWDLEDGWTVVIEGAPGVQLRIGLSDPTDVPDRSRAIQYAVAGPVIRAIPAVCTASPGILTVPAFAAYSPRLATGSDGRVGPLDPSPDPQGLGKS